MRGSIEYGGGAFRTARWYWSWAAIPAARPPPRAPRRPAPVSRVFHWGPQSEEAGQGLGTRMGPAWVSRARHRHRPRPCLARLPRSGRHCAPRRAQARDPDPQRPGVSGLSAVAPRQPRCGEWHPVAWPGAPAGVAGCASTRPPSPTVPSLPSPPSFCAGSAPPTATTTSLYASSCLQCDCPASSSLGGAGRHEPSPPPWMRAPGARVRLQSIRSGPPPRPGRKPGRVVTWSSRRDADRQHRALLWRRGRGGVNTRCG